MTLPVEYERATAQFYDYLVDARDIAELWSTHVAYTMTQGVFQTFRRRLTVEESIQFANALPACLRALFIADWNLSDDRQPFGDRSEMTQEVKALRAEHNFSPETAIQDVAKALRRHVDEARFNAVLAALPPEARDFWSS